MTLDKTDWVLVRELDKDVRISLTQLAKKARISKEKAHYRLRRLEQSVITGYWAQQRIGNQANAYKVFLKDKSLGQRKDELIAYIMSYKGAAWIAETEGRWDIVVSNYASSDTDFVLFFRELLRRFGTLLREKTITKMTGAVSLNEKYLHDESFVRVSKDDFTREPPTYDELDLIIMNALSRNARMPYTELAKTAGVTSETVGNRVRKLLRNDDFVDLKLRVNHAALGLTYYHVLLSLEHYEMQETITQYYTQHPRCVYIMTHLGAYDIHLELVLPSLELPLFLTDLSERFGPSLSAYEVLRIVREHRMQIQY